MRTKAARSSDTPAGRSRLIVGFGGLLLTGLSAWVSPANENAAHPVAMALVSAGTVALLYGVGVFAWRREPANRFGRMMILAAVGSFLVSLSASGDSLLYSTGRVSFWLLQPLLIYLFLSYPSGRLPGRLDRAVVVTAWMTVLLLYVPTALVVDQYPLLPTYCSVTCPANAFEVVPGEPAFVQALLVPVRETITVGIYVATALVMLGRLQASRLMRRSLTPVFAAVLLRNLALISAVVARRMGASAEALEPFVWVSMLSVPVAALGILVGLLRWRVYAAGVLESLALSADDPADPERLQVHLREALDDPTLQLHLPAAQTPPIWSADAERSVTPAPDRFVVEVKDDGDVIAAIACDPALEHQHSIVEAVGFWVRAVLVRQRLRAELDVSLRRVEESRRRLATAAALERRRIERDLHDGAQQWLVSLRIKLSLAAEAIDQHPERGAELVRDLAPWVDSTIEEVRSIARGIYPSLLADAGLEEALRDVVRIGQTRTTFHSDGVGRYAPEIEAAVYFCCVEALQNVSKHAHASTASVEVKAVDGEIRFDVCDDGCGFAPSNGNGGVGLTNMHDRVSALGGSMVIESQPGSGTAVCGRVPIRPS